jgi:predicted AAA+ superfamily ATPase
MIHRTISLSNSNSYFLFGARGTGKTTLINALYKKEHTHYFNLLNLDEEARLIRDPELLGRMIDQLGPEYSRIVIDEIQRAPKLLDVVHRKIEERKKEGKPLQFVMTGSSARKLRRGAANLLAGRAFTYNLFPLTNDELGKTFDLKKILELGSLPQIFSLDNQSDQHRYLESYCQVYLKEEVWNEQIIRKLAPFSNFLEIAAQTNGQIINYSNVARDIGVDTKTVQSYYQILEDTLIGFSLPAYHRSLRKRQVKNPKFYFFDTGVKRALERTLTVPLLPQTYAFGRAFEHFLILEMQRLNEYYKKDYRFSYLKTHDGAEIDVIIERPGLPTALVEIKSSEKADSRMSKHLDIFLDDFKKSEGFCLSLDKTEQRIGKIVFLPWQKGLKELGLCR